MAASSIGARLHEERLGQLKELASISAETKIALSILKAIENDDFPAMPGGAYRRSFLRQYARALGVDEAAILDGYGRQFQEPELPLPRPPRRKSRVRVYLSEAGCLLLAASALIGF
jgi:cytoskeletal protein RodZ